MSYLDELDEQWKKWLTENLNRGVPIKKMATSLFNKGWTNAALELMAQHNEAVSMPYIDLSKNAIELSDRNVSLLFSSSKPFVVVIDNFMTRGECQKMIDLADDKLQNSKVVNPEDGSFIEHHARTSTSTGFQRGETKIIKTIEKRISELLSWPIEHGEGLQVLRYEDGGEYKAHYDYFDTNKKSSEVVMKKGGQRLGTFLMYLSDVEAGGSTRFPLANFEVRPKAGMALYFGNTNLDGTCEQQSLHASIPVTTGVKYLATKWLREKPYV